MLALLVAFGLASRRHGLGEGDAPPDYSRAVVAPQSKGCTRQSKVLGSCAEAVDSAASGEIAEPPRL